MADLQAGDGSHPTLQGLYVSILKDKMGRGVSTHWIYTVMISSKALQGMNDAVSIKGEAN